MRNKYFLLVILSFVFFGCKSETNNPVEPIENKTIQSVLSIDNVQCLSSRIGLIISLLDASIKSEYINPNLSLTFSETSPHDTFSIITNGILNPLYDSTGIPMADNHWGIRAHLAINNLIDTTFNPFDSLYYYNFIESVKISPYHLISQDTIEIKNPWTLFWKNGYRIDTLKIKVYVKESLDLFLRSIGGMNYEFTISEYDSIKHIISHTVGIPIMNSQPIIFIDPIAKINYNYENKYLKLKTFLYYLQEETLMTWEL